MVEDNTGPRVHNALGEDDMCVEPLLPDAFKVDEAPHGGQEP